MTTNVHTKRGFRLALIAICIIALVLTALPFAGADVASAAEPTWSDSGTKVYYKRGDGKMTKQVMAYKDAEGNYHFNPSDKANMNCNYLTQLIKGNKKKTIILPPKKIKMQGTFKPGSNTTIIAKGATIQNTKKGANAMSITPKSSSSKYDSISNIKVIGGKWRAAEKSGRKGPMFWMGFCNHITLDGVDVNCNVEGHAIEIVACRDITIKNCKVVAIGSTKKKEIQEMIQIDISTPRTSSTAARLGKSYVKGQTCRNIRIENNYVKGPIAVGINWEKKHLSKYHKNMKVLNNELVGTKSAALNLGNTIGFEIKGNKVKGVKGIYVANYGKPPKALKKAKGIINSNIVKGKKKALKVNAKNRKIGKLIVTGNKFYCKKGKKKAYSKKEIKKSSYKRVIKKNKAYKW